MKESYKEGVANRFGPESCADAREDEGEALTGVRAGWPLSRETNHRPRKWPVLRGADAVEISGRKVRPGAHAVHLG